MVTKTTLLTYNLCYIQQLHLVDQIKFIIQLYGIYIYLYIVKINLNIHNKRSALSSRTVNGDFSNKSFYWFTAEIKAMYEDTFFANGLLCFVTNC